MGIRQVLAAGGMVLAGALGTAGPAAAVTAQARTASAAPAQTPTTSSAPVSVVPSTGLAGGATVLVTASGITPSAQVQAIQCDIFTGDPEQDCFPRAVTTADDAGDITLSVTLGDPVLRNQPFGDPTPVYCRADICRIFLAWLDQEGNQQVISSDPLTFTGSPATIAANKHAALSDGERIRVRGTAYGAQGHRVLVLEEACFSIVQGSGCYGQLSEAASYVHRNGHYAVSYRVHRFLSDGTDCAAQDILGFCEMNVIVLTHGQPDDSFGVSGRGQPALALTFAGGS